MVTHAMNLAMLVSGMFAFECNHGGRVGKDARVRCKINLNINLDPRFPARRSF